MMIIGRIGQANRLIVFSSALALLWLFLSSCSIQKHDLVYDYQSGLCVYKHADLMPTYNGIDPWYIGLLKEFTSLYRYQAKDDEVLQTTLKFQFVITKEGKMVGARIVGKKNSELSQFEQEGLRTLYLCDKWSPGKINNKNVNVLLSDIILIELR